MLTLRKFKALAESYGAELQRWPEETRGEAKALLESSPQAMALLREAWELDEVISAARDREAAERWPAGEEEAALARLRSGVAAQIASSRRGRRVRGSGFGWGGWAGVHAAVNAHIEVVGLTLGSGLSIVAGGMIGLMYGATPVSDSLLTVLQAAPLHIFG
jgi:hypothetical protein